MMRRTILLVATMALTLLVASGVALAVTKISTNGPDGGVVLAQGSTTLTTPAQEQQSGTTVTLSSGRCSSSTKGQLILVMTRNLYVGADLGPVSAAAATGDGPAIVQATTNAWQGVKATNFPERAGALASEIENAEPLLVGLQEVSLF